MQVNSINSFSNAQAFRGAEEGESKGINKKAVAAGVVGAAAVAGTVALGLHGKKVAEVAEDAKIFKKVGTYIAEGAKDVFGTVRSKAAQAIEFVKGKFHKAEKVAEDVAENAEGVAEAAAKAAQ